MTLALDAAIEPRSAGVRSASEPLRIVVTADPYLPVPPKEYGGIERVVDFLVSGLVARGHEVTLLAHPDSLTPARLIPYGRPPHVGWRPRLDELAQAGRALWRNRAVDVVHSFGRLAALLPILPKRSLPKVQSYQRDRVPWRSVDRAVRLAGASLTFTGCSSSVYRHRPGTGRGGEWRTIFNGVDTSKYTARPSVPYDAPLVFLGRIEPIKGAHHAIEIARAAGRDLVLAGTIGAGVAERAYFHDRIAPRIDDARVRYVGPVNDEAKNELLGGAAALLMPIDWEEPFGIVMAEAFACGTPVVAFARGSVPEVVRDGVNGFACRTVGEAVAAVRRVSSIDRLAVRADCDARFGAERIVDQYVGLYRALRERVTGIA